VTESAKIKKADLPGWDYRYAVLMHKYGSTNLLSVDPKGPQSPGFARVQLTALVLTAQVPHQVSTSQEPNMKGPATKPARPADKPSSPSDVSDEKAPAAAPAPETESHGLVPSVSSLNNEPKKMPAFLPPLWQPDPVTAWAFMAGVQMLSLYGAGSVWGGFKFLVESLLERPRQAGHLLRRAA
jgi:hypothetical protein